MKRARHRRHLPSIAVALGLSAQLPLACEPKVTVGDWPCTGRPAQTGDAGAPNEPAPITFDPVALPWSSGFEGGFCDFARVDGFCYGDPGASYTLVTSPVHSGRFAAAFSVRGDGSNRAKQVRCVRQGRFPMEGYYSAWYFIPAFATNLDNWNLLHFQGADPPADLRNLWDVSLVSDDSNALRLRLLSYESLLDPEYADAMEPIPIGAWFQIKVRFRRASNATGELSVFQDGELVAQMTNLVTDDTIWGQLYVGNYATDLMPVDSTVFVDDVVFSDRP